MKLFERPIYLKKLLDFKDSQFIKVITGVRRSGKSYLMLLYRQYLLEHGVSEKQIIYLSFEDLHYFKLRKMEVLYDYLLKKVFLIKGCTFY